MQVLMVFCLIAFAPRPLAVSVIVYVTVAVTVLSGADYFFGLRRRLSELAAEQRTGATSGGGAEPGL
jgi:CDP-diacylglycerol--glycerol-3-phosphate 3-phosphatidyltransferase